MVRLITVFFLIFACTIISSGARAQESGNRSYLSVLGSYVDDDQDRNVDDGLTGGQFAIGIPFRDAWSIELFGLYNDFNADGFDNDQEQTGLGVGLIRWFNRSGLLSPYAGIAGGYADTKKTAGRDESSPMTSGALGMLLGFGDSSFAWRSEVRYRRVLEDLALSDIYLSSGLQWSFGARRDRGSGGSRSDSDGDGVADAFDLCPDSSATVVDARGCPEADNDLDGVVNRLDRCPRTPRNVKVNSRGCPPDSDRDGVIDALDACRGTPWGTGVDERGCPLFSDADGDGVPDTDDQCPNTAAGVPVASNGCPIPQRIALPGVVFDNNSSQLKASSRATLNDVADILKANPGLRAEVAGHTDSLGDAAYNQWLSQRRAQTVRDYLVGRGIAADRLTARGYGESEPVAADASAAGRARNRRVELRIMEQ